MTKRALVTGAGGQDGYYLLRLLADLDYDIVGQTHSAGNRDGLPSRVRWHVGDLTDARFLASLLGEAAPDEIYNLAAVSSTRLAWQMPRQTAELNAFVPQQICQWIIESRPSCRLFQASSSEIFGPAQAPLQNEQTACTPQSPYGIAKLYAHSIVAAYRRQYDLHACSGILFNHESPRRPLSFVSQKIAHAAAAISLGIEETAARGDDGRPIVSGGKIRLGNLDVRRDFGFAGDYVEAMHLILQHPTADDYVVGTGQSHSIGEFCETAFRQVGLDWRDHVVVDNALRRKDDNLFTCADSSKLQRVLGWAPKKRFDELVSLMVSANIRILETARSMTGSENAS